MVLNFAMVFMFLALPCAIESISSGLLKCYQCRNVNDLSLCNSETTCPQDELCGIENTYSVSGSLSYSMGCRRKHPCIEVTRFRLENQELFQHGQIGKRSGLTACAACCGSTLCNTGDCFDITRKLQESWKAGRLNLTTLAYNV